MKKRKNIGRRVLVFVLTIAMVLSFSTASFGANWTSFRGNSSNNAVTSAKTPVQSSDAMLYWASKNGTGWSAAPGSPILVNGYLYFNAGDKIVKMDSVSGKIVKTGQMVDKSAFSICPPTYANGKIYVALSNGVIQAFNGKTLKSLWVYKDKLGGQPNTPITYYNGYIYAGFWRSETAEANFVCLKAKDENKKKTNEPKNPKWSYGSVGGFYWAGAYANKNFVLVGTDDGASGYESQTSKLIAFSPKTGKVLSQITGLNADIRSSISYDKQTKRYYFTSKGGSFYSVKVSSKGKISDLKEIKLGGMSTSTPTVYKERAYVGVAGNSQFGKYGGHNISVIDLKNWEIAYIAPTMGYPQTSGLVTKAYEKEDGGVYVYFFDNYTPGKLRVLKDKPGQKTFEGGTAEPYEELGISKTIQCASSLFTPSGNQAQYAICSPIVDKYGTIYFKNDSSYMMAVGSKIKEIKITEKPEKTTYKVGDKVNLSGIKVVAKLTNGLTRDITKYVTTSSEKIVEGQRDITIFYEYSMYNNDGEAEPLFTTLDIKLKK